MEISEPDRIGQQLNFGESALAQAFCTGRRLLFAQMHEKRMRQKGMIPLDIPKGWPPPDFNQTFQPRWPWLLWVPILGSLYKNLAYSSYLRLYWEPIETSLIHQLQRRAHSIPFLWKDVDKEIVKILTDIASKENGITVAWIHPNDRFGLLCAVGSDNMLALQFCLEVEKLYSITINSAEFKRWVFEDVSVCEVICTVQNARSWGTK